MVTFLVVLTVVIIMTVVVFKKVDGFYSSSSKKEGGVMAEPGQHRHLENDSIIRRAFPDEFTPLETVEPWIFTHHLYQPVSFPNAKEAFMWVNSRARKGRKESWHVKPPGAVVWTGALPAICTVAEFIDYYLDTMPRKSAELIIA